jgi:hypothetical protein
MHDDDTLRAESAQVIRREMVARLAPYRPIIKLLPIPSYLKADIARTIQALDRWTAETEASDRG